MSLFLETPDWERPTDFPRLRGYVGLDFETVDPYIKTHGPSWAFPGVGKVIGIGISMENGFDAYYPVGHTQGNMDDPAKVWAWLKDQLENPDPSLVIVVFNWQYEMGWLRRNGINPRCPVVDPMMAMQLVDECRMSYSLNAIAKTVLKDVKLGDELSKFAEQLGVKDHMSKLDRIPPMYVGPYCEKDASLARQLWHPLKEDIEKFNLGRVLQLEHDVMPAVLDMRYDGVRIDEDRLAREIAKTEQAEKDVHEEIKRICGRHIEVWSQESIADAFVLEGIKYPLSPTGKPSFTADWLESHPADLPQLVVKARQLNKLHSTFLTNYFAEMMVNGRIHCTFNPLRGQDGGAISGRFSSANPNLQNLPARKGDAAKTVRGNLLPEEGQQWAALDYSSQEPRLTVHFAYLTGCPGADKVVAGYRENPRTDYHQFVADLTGLPRKRAKEINLGLPYGMGGAKFCTMYLQLPTRWAIFRKREKTLHFETYEAAREWCQDNGFDRSPIEVAGEEGQAILNQYHERLPYTKSLMEKTTKAAENRGYIRTLLGRRRHFLAKGEQPGGYNKKKAFPYKALNALIQGSAADQTKQAMVDLHREGFKMLVTVHDELGLSVENEAEARRAADIMENSTPLEVPTVVDVEIGDSWAASMGLPDEDE